MRGGGGGVQLGFFFSFKNNGVKNNMRVVVSLAQLPAQPSKKLEGSGQLPIPISVSLEGCMAYGVGAV